MSTRAISVSDSLSSTNEHIEEAAKAIGRSAIKRRVFGAIYTGKKKTKSVSELALATKLPRKKILDAAKFLVKRQITNQVDGSHGNTQYEKIDFFHTHKAKILSLAGEPKKLATWPTKRRLVTISSKPILMPTQFAKTQMITVDDIDSFKRVRKVNPSGYISAKVSETAFKKGILKILVQQGVAKDWGGEKNDIHTTYLKIGGKRRAVAFALKGPGTKGKLIPKKMGKNGDQIQRLFTSTAEVFIVQYWNEIDQSVLDLMEPLAVAKSTATGNKVWFGVMDGTDSNRLYLAYPSCF